MTRSLLLLAALVANLPTVAYAETLLAVGTLYGAPRSGLPGLETTPLLLRYSQGAWETVASPPVASGQLVAVTLTSAEEGWAVGASDHQAMFLHTMDGGRTWQDVTSRLPRDLASRQRIRAIRFVSQTHGYIISETAGNIGPYLTSTSDGGKTWATRSVDSQGFNTAYAVFERAFGTVLATADGRNIRLSFASGARVDEQLADYDTGLLQVASAAWSGTRLWIGATGAASPEAVNNVPALISWSQDAGWQKHSGIFEAHSGEVRGISFTAAADGLLALATTEEVSRPRVFSTHDGAQHWQEGKLPDDLDGTMVSSVLAKDARVSWISLNVAGSSGTAILTTQDGGQTWARTTTGVDGAAHVHDLAIWP